MPDAFRFVMTEHAAWRATSERIHRVFALSDGGQCLVTVNCGAPTYQPLTPGSPRPQLDTFTLAGAGIAMPTELAGALAALGTVARFRTADLWEAIATAIIRQVVRAGQARRLYHGFCDAYGQYVTDPGGSQHALFPTAGTVLSLDDGQFASAGLTFKRRTLRAAAEAYAAHGNRWRSLTPAALVDELQQVPRIGPWTAGAAVADFSNDFGCYPHADLAVRTWARRVAPSHPWPASELAFGQMWRELAGGQPATTTLLTLAWGNQHADTS